ncbi:MAG TPA: HdeD family acid-resistance protein [Pseudonocardiaceae bacterium]|nr:HdeD family acid-resistance protein [Pseudonocardiaceae bacterium]
MSDTTETPRAPDPEGPLRRLGRRAWQSVLLAGIAAIVLGVLVLVWPGETLVLTGILFGIYLLVSGVSQLVAAFGTHVRAELRVLAFLSGAMSIVLGLFCLRGALESILLLALWIGIGWLFRGITHTIAAVSDPATPARGWQIFFGVISVLAGIMLVVSPFASVAVLIGFGGYSLLVLGVVEVVTAIQIRGGTRQLPREI